jgi:hypothetical protein
MKKQCPGMDPAYFKPDDIGMQKCTGCNEDIELWKDELFIDFADAAHETRTPERL